MPFGIGIGLGMWKANKPSSSVPALALRPVATRVKQTFVATHGSDGVNTQGKFLVRHKVLPGGCASGLKLAFGNRCSEANGFNSITVAARVRYPAGNGTWYPATFSAAGNVTITASGADAWTDVVANLPAMLAGEMFETETYVTVASAGMKWPTIDNMALLGANGEGLLLATTDISASTPTPGDSGATEIYAPVAIIGQSTATRAFAIIGDSIANGASDTPTGHAMGFIERVFNSTYPTLNLATSSERIAQFSSAHTNRVALMQASGITDIIFAFGTNDVANADTYATIRGNLLAVLAYLASLVPTITVCPILTKTDAALNPSGAYAVAGIADQVNTFETGVDIGLVSKVWDTRPGWQNASNQILSATYTDDFLHPNPVGNAAIAAAAPALSTIIAPSVLTAPLPSAWFTSEWIYLRPASLGLADNTDVTSWSDTRSLVTAVSTGDPPKYRTNMTPGGKPAIKFSVAGTGLQKLVIPHSSAVDNIMNTGAWGALYTITRYASAGGNATGRVWTKGAGETEALTTATNLRTTVDFNTTDIQLNATTAINTWYVRQFYKNASNAGTLYQNVLIAATATGTGTTTHVDNAANDFIIGNHDSLARGWDGDIAAIAIWKGTGTIATADTLAAVQAYLRADTGVTII